MPFDAPYIAFAQAPVSAHGACGTGERDLRGLDGTSQIGDEDSGDAVVTPPSPELLGKRPASLGETAGKPPTRNAALVVDADGVGLEDDFDAQTRPLSLSTSRLVRLAA